MPNKVFSILDSVDKDVFKPMNRDYAKTLVEEFFKIKLGDKVLLHVNPGPRKGTHILIKAVAILERILWREIRTANSWEAGIKTYREYIVNIVRGLKLEENVKMLGYVENKLLPALYNDNVADITIVPSYSDSEGGPLITPESLACGTLVIATSVGGNPEYLEIVHLDPLLVRIRDYDFSVTLTNKMFIALQEEWN
ncbi:MAG: glycosyltransferase, partial [Desulfurococcaceae archaeon]|nr:glycosyltransferase [Desulfurococcaceae archaeon]